MVVILYIIVDDNLLPVQRRVTDFLTQNLNDILML